MQGLRPFSKTLPLGLKKMLNKRSYNFSNIVDNWTKMVGKDISNACYPTKVRINKNMNESTLILNVVHGNELDIEYSKQQIIEKINSFFGFNFIKEVKLKIIQEKRNLEKVKKLNEYNKKYNNNLDDFRNQNLKESLNKLIKAYNEKNN